jgi:uncharacterized membrane protein
MSMPGFCRGLFAIASASLAILSLTYGDFAPGGLSLPAWIPWPQAWVHGAAILVLAASVGIFFPRTALPSALTIGAYEALWALIAAPGILAQPLSFGAWYPVAEALSSLVGAWILYLMLRGRSLSSDTAPATGRSLRAAQLLFGLSCVFYGASHFAYASYTATMVPTWLPAPLGLAYFTGLCHIAAGVGITVGILSGMASTLEAVMMSLFGLLVWAPSFFTQPTPAWATPPKNQWSEVVVNLTLAAAAWIVAASFTVRPWPFTGRARTPTAA